MATFQPMLTRAERGEVPVAPTHVQGADTENAWIYAGVIPVGFEVVARNDVVGHLPIFRIKVQGLKEERERSVWQVHSEDGELVLTSGEGTRLYFGFPSTEPMERKKQQSPQTLHILYSILELTESYFLSARADHVEVVGERNENGATVKVRIDFCLHINPVALTFEPIEKQGQIAEKICILSHVDGARGEEWGEAESKGVAVVPSCGVFLTERGHMQVSCEVCPASADEEGLPKFDFLSVMSRHPCPEGSYEPPHMKIPLYRYQKASIAAMMRREEQATNVGSPIFHAFRLASGTYYLDIKTGYFRQQPQLIRPVRGGILCEEMGTGKTAICIGLIAATKGTMAECPKDVVLEQPHPLYPSNNLQPCLCGCFVRNQTTATCCHCHRECHPQCVPVNVPHINWECSECAEITELHARKTGTLEYVAAAAMWRHGLAHRIDELPLDLHPLVSTMDRAMYWQPIRSPVGSADDRRRQAATRLPTHPSARAARVHPNPSTHHPVYLSSSTLVAVPPDLVHHWRSQFTKHVEDGALTVLVIDRKIPPANQLLGYDVIIISHQLLSTEEARWNATGVPSELMRVHWLRVIVDEGHVVGNEWSSRTVMVQALFTDRRWICSGTPAPESIQDTVLKHVHGLLTFLFVEPIISKMVWTSLTKKLNTNVWPAQFLEGLLHSLMVRNSEESVEMDHRLPRLTELDVLLPLAPHEIQRYNEIVSLLQVNMIVSERDGVDYILHPGNAKHAVRSFNSLWEVCTHKDEMTYVERAVALSEISRFISRYCKSPRMQADIAALRACKRVLVQHVPPSVMADDPSTSFHPPKDLSEDILAQPNSEARPLGVLGALFSVNGTLLSCDVDGFIVNKGAQLPDIPVPMPKKGDGPKKSVRFKFEDKVYRPDEDTDLPLAPRAEKPQFVHQVSSQTAKEREAIEMHKREEKAKQEEKKKKNPRAGTKTQGSPMRPSAHPNHHPHGGEKKGTLMSDIQMPYSKNSKGEQGDRKFKKSLRKILRKRDPAPMASHGSGEANDIRPVEFGGSGVGGPSGSLGVFTPPHSGLAQPGTPTLSNGSITKNGNDVSFRIGGSQVAWVVAPNDTKSNEKRPYSIDQSEEGTKEEQNERPMKKVRLDVINLTSDKNSPQPSVSDLRSSPIKQLERSESSIVIDDEEIDVMALDENHTNKSEGADPTNENHSQTGGAGQPMIVDEREGSCFKRKVLSVRSTSTKLSALMERLERLLPMGKKIVIFSQFEESLYYVSTALEYAEIQYIPFTKIQKPEVRAQNVTTFNTGTFHRVFLADMRLAAFGLDLSAATHVIFMEPVVNRAVYRQAVKRAHRIGQMHDVTVEVLATKHTVEEDLIRDLRGTHERKGESKGFLGQYRKTHRLILSLRHLPLPNEPITTRN